MGPRAHDLIKIISNQIQKGILGILGASKWAIPSFLWRAMFLQNNGFLNGYFKGK